MIGKMFAVPALIVAAPVLAQTAANPQVAIEAAMADSVAGWNAGDLDRFLAVYSNEAATSFTTSDGVVRGKATIRARYLDSYGEQFGADASTRSMLAIELRDFRMLGADHAIYIGRWTLTGGQSTEMRGGYTSLVFRKEASGWKIVADHSS